MLPIRDSLYFKDAHSMKVKGQNKIFQANDNQKRTGVIILRSK